MNRLLKGLALFLLLPVVGAVSALAVVAFLLRQEEVRVPDLTGRDIVTVVEAISQQGLQLKIERSEPNRILPKDTVISQYPASGNTIKKGRPVRVILSIGPSDFQAPSVVGEHYRKADLLIRQAGFIPAAIARASSDTIERDVVIAQAPQPGTPLEKGGAVSILVSSGKSPVLYAAPAVTGKRAEEAIRIVQRMGFQHRVAYKPTEPGASQGRVVLSQKPAGGHPLEAEGIIELVVGAPAAAERNTPGAL